MADKGIFDIIGSGVQKVLGNPFIQGMGLMAATGFNPAIGLLAGNVIKDDRTRSKLENDALRARIDSERDRLNAANEFSNLVTSRRDQYVPPMPLLGIDGTSPGTVGDFNRSVPALQTPGGQQEAMGLFGRMAPAAAANAFAGSMGGGRVPADIQVAQEITRLRNAGRNEEAELLQTLAMPQQGNPFESLIDQAQLAALLQQNQRETTETQREEQERGQAQTLFRSNLLDSFDQLIELGTINDQLRGTSQAPGLPAAETRRTLGAVGAELGPFFGVDTEELTGNVAARDAFKKTASNIQFDVLQDADIGSSAQRILERFFEGTASLDIDPSANDLIIANQLRGRLAVADAKAIQLPPEKRAQIEAAIQMFEERGKAGIGQGAGSGGSGDTDFTFDGQNVN